MKSFLISTAIFLLLAGGGSIAYQACTGCFAHDQPEAGVRQTAAVAPVTYQERITLIAL